MIHPSSRLVQGLPNFVRGGLLNYGHLYLTLEGFYCVDFSDTILAEESVLDI